MLQYINFIPPACNEHNLEQPVAFALRNRLEVVYLARYSPEKNHALAVQAFAQVIKAVPSATLQMYGSGSLKEKIKVLVEELGLQGSVSVNGYGELRQPLPHDQRDLAANRFAHFHGPADIQL